MSIVHKEKQSRAGQGCSIPLHSKRSFKCHSHLIRSNIAPLCGGVTFQLRLVCACGLVTLSDTTTSQDVFFGIREVTPGRASVGYSPLMLGGRARTAGNVEQLVVENKLSLRIASTPEAIGFSVQNYLRKGKSCSCPWSCLSVCPVRHIC